MFDMKIDTSIVIENREGVYEPAEDTYLLIESLSVLPGERVLEIGAGTGIVSLHCAKAGAQVTAVDISEEAVDCTRRNAMRNLLTFNVSRSDLFENVNGRFDLIIFNPPYLPDTEQRDARWSGGRTGLDIVRRFLVQARSYLEKDGRIVLVLSSLDDLSDFQELSRSLEAESRLIGEKKLFFETIRVIELRMIPR